MLNLEGGKFSKPFTLGIWMLMAFQAGYVNVGSFSIFGNFASHVTGTSSQIGMALAGGKSEIFFTFLTILAAFITGAAIPGHFIGRMKEEGKRQNFELVSAVKAFFFGLVLILSLGEHSHLLRLSSETIHLVMVFFLSFCCGIQNATCILATGGFLKPTHMTGLSTDIGIALTKVFAYRAQPKLYAEELRKNFVRLGILCAFIFGGGIAALIFAKNGAYGFIFPFFSSLCFFGVSLAGEKAQRGYESVLCKTGHSLVLAAFIATLFIGFAG